MAITAGQSSNTWLKNIESKVYYKKMCRNLYCNVTFVSFVASLDPEVFPTHNLFLSRARGVLRELSTDVYLTQNNRGDFTNICWATPLYTAWQKWMIRWENHGSKLSNPEMSSWHRIPRMEVQVRKVRDSLVLMVGLLQRMLHILVPGSTPQKKKHDNGKTNHLKMYLLLKDGDVPLSF